MLNYNEIVARKYIVLDGDPFEVLSAQTSKKGRGQASNQTKLKKLRTGKVVDRAFHQADTVAEADIEKQAIQYIYNRNGEYWFFPEGKPSERFSISASVVGAGAAYLKENEVVDALIFNEDIIGIQLPIKVALKVTEAPPNVRGNTAQGGTKQVTVETGATVTTPMFIEEGDTIRVNTQTGEYVERT